MSNFQLVIITIIGWAIGSIFYKLASQHMHPVMISIIVSGFYLVFAPIQFAIFKPTLTVSAAGISYALLAAAAMAIGSLAYIFVLKRGGAVGQITSLTSVYPALTMIFSVILLGESITLKKIVGICLALSSVYILSIK